MQEARVRHQSRPCRTRASRRLFLFYFEKNCAHDAVRSNVSGWVVCLAATVADITLITSIMLQTVQQSEKRSRIGTSRCTVQQIPAGDIQSGNADANALSVVLDLLT